MLVTGGVARIKLRKEGIRENGAEGDAAVVSEEG